MTSIGPCSVRRSEPHGVVDAGDCGALAAALLAEERPANR